MNLAELIDEVYVQTGRPDLVDKTSSAVRAATLYAHKTDFYPKDLLETAVVFSPADYQHSIDTDIFPRYRKVKWARKYDNATATVGAFFEIITPDEIMDEYGIDRTDIMYEAGQNIKLNSSTEIEHILIGVYQTPDVTSLNYNSWIADEAEYLIIHDAARRIFASIGNLEQAKVQQDQRDEQLLVFRNSATALKGE